MERSEAFEALCRMQRKSGSILPFAAFFTNDRLAAASSFGRSAALWVSDVTRKSVLLGI